MKLFYLGTQARVLCVNFEYILRPFCLYKALVKLSDKNLMGVLLLLIEKQK